MKKDEYYQSEEFSRGTAEYKAFSAEIYAKTTDYTPTAPEIGNTGAEIATERDTAATDSAEKKKNARQKSKEFLEKLHGSTRAVGGVGTVAGAVGTVAVAATVIGAVDLLPQPQPEWLPPPQMEVAELTVTADCVQYDLFLEEPVEGAEYFVVISGEDGTKLEFGVDIGRNERIVPSLTPDTEYTFQFVGRADAKAETVHHQEKFSTRDESYRTAFFSVQTAIYEDLEVMEYAVYLSDPLKTEGQYALQVSLGEDIYYSDDALSEDGYFRGYVSDLIEGTFVYSVVDLLNAEEYVVGSFEYEYLFTEGCAPVPEITLHDDIALTSAKQAEIPYDVYGVYTQTPLYGTLRILAQYDTGETEELSLENVQLNSEGTLLLSQIPTGARTVTFTGEYSYVTAGGWENVGRMEEREFTLPQLVLVNATVNVENGNYATLQFINRSGYGLFVIDGNGIEYEAVDGQATFEVTDETAGTCGYELRDESGAAVSERQNLTLRTDVTGDFVFNYTNPGNVLKTFNGDGTQNIYMTTDFESADPDIYYEIEYRSGGSEERYYYRSREVVAKLEDIAMVEYYLVFNVYKEVDGIRYLLYSVAPSGDTGASPFNPYKHTVTLLETTATEQTFEIAFGNNGAYDLDSVKITLDDGTELLLSSSDFTNDSERMEYVATVKVELGVTPIKLSVMANDYASLYDQVAALTEIKGEKYSLLEEEILL